MPLRCLLDLNLGAAPTPVVQGVLVIALAAAATAQEGVPAGVRVERDLAYVTGGGARQSLDLYWHPESGSPRPVVVFIHGGAWRAGDKSAAERFVGPLLHHGYAVASVNYRLSQDSVFPAQIRDVKAAVRWLRDNAGRYRLELTRFGAWGPSAGAHLATLLGTTGDPGEWDSGENVEQSSRVQAVVGWYGPSDFLRMNEAGGTMDHDAPDSPESQLVGGPIQQHPERAREANPITYVTPDDPPFLLMHGSEDRLVPASQSLLLHAALEAAGVPSTLEVLEGLGHGGDGWRQRIRRVVEFFDEHLAVPDGGFEDRRSRPHRQRDAPG